MSLQINPSPLAHVGASLGCANFDSMPSFFAGDGKRGGNVSVASGAGTQSGGSLTLLSRGGGNFSVVVGEATSGLGGQLGSALVRRRMEAEVL